jgi:phosphoribosyl 1,2-cyclic phosphate phosphodiesterase
MSYRFTILGSGSSGGVPRLGNDWGKCDPENPKNRRLRCAALIERFSPRGVTTVLIDSGPDIREQLLSVRLEALDAVIYTHDHADHTHGIDDLRVLCYRMRHRIDAWLDASTEASLMTRFGYCFESPPGRSYPPILNARRIEPGVAFDITGAGGRIGVHPVRQAHGEIDSLGFRVGGVAYSPDISGLTEESVRALSGLDVWIVDALRYMPHPSHFTVAQALDWIERLKPKRAILTHLHVDLDYDTLKRELPADVEPAYDGLQFHFD